MRWLAQVCLTLALAGCGSDDSISTRNAAEKLRPDAGADQSVAVGAAVTLDGSASTGSGVALRYRWESVSDRVQLENQDAAVTSFTALEPGVFPFLLWISNKSFHTAIIDSEKIISSLFHISKLC